MNTIFSARAEGGGPLTSKRLFARVLWIWVKILALVLLGHTDTVSFIYAGF